MATKKKKMQTIIIKPPKVKPFNLSLENQAENTRIILALEALKASAGWLFLTQLFEANKKILADIIITKMDGERVLKEVEVDEARFKHGYLKELMGKPDEYLKKLRPKANPIDELDPYDQGEKDEF